MAHMERKFTFCNFTFCNFTFTNTDSDDQLTGKFYSMKIMNENYCVNQNGKTATVRI